MLNKIIRNLTFQNCIVAISHTDYLTSLGGTEKVIQEEHALFAERKISYIQIYPLLHPLPGFDTQGKDRNLQLIGLNVDGKNIGNLSLSVFGMILEAMSRCGVSILAVHIHHLLGMNPAAVGEIIKNIKAEVRFFLHDYHSACPQHNFLKNKSEYCGGPSINSTECGDCCLGNERPVQYNIYKEFFRKTVTSFVAPSDIAKKIWAKSYPELEHKVRVVPHQIHKPTNTQIFAPNKRLRIAYVGYQAPNKGWETWRNLVEGIGGEYELYHIGDCDDHLPSVKNISVSFITDGQDCMTKALRDNKIDIAFLWSIWPETYSFTVFESLSAGCFIITNPISGNIAAQIRATGRGMIFDSESALKEFFANSRAVADLVKKNQDSFQSFDLVFNPEIPDEESKKVDQDNFCLDKNEVISCFEKSGIRKDIEHQIEIGHRIYSLIIINVASLKRKLTKYPRIKKILKLFLFR